MDKYIVRYAAGSWWLILPEQKTGYIAPLRINESAAEIIGYLNEGMEPEAVAERLAEGDADLKQEIIQDINELCSRIHSHFQQLS